MRILVTGGTGNVGRKAVERLVRHGHEVLVVGRREGLTIDGAEYQSCDINDFDAVREAVRGREGIVHLAAIPNPSMGPGHEIFRVNCSGTFNIFEAAAQEEIKRVVSASSINAFGFNFGVKPFPIRYFPVDEAHETFTTDPYSFSKQVVEDIADYYWRRDGISSVSLRLPGVYEVGGDMMERRLAHRQAMIDRFVELYELPDREQRRQVQEIIDRHNNVVRSERLFELSRESREMREPWEIADFAMMMQMSNFWANVDARDSAQAIEQGLTVPFEGSHTLFINDDHNAAGLDSKILSALFFPGVPWKHEPQGDESLVSIERARQLLGFEPEYRSPGRVTR